MAGLAGQGPHHYSHISVGHRTRHRAADAESHPSALVHRSCAAVVHDFGFLLGIAFLLGRVPNSIAAPGAYGSGAGHARGLRNRRRRQLAEFPLSARHYRRLDAAATKVGVLYSRPCIHSLRQRSRADVLRHYPFLLDHASSHTFAASDHSDQLGRLFRGGLFNGIAGCETASGGCEAEVREGSAKKSSSLAREHYSVHHRRSDYHWPRWSHHFGEYGSEEAAAELRP